MLKPFLRSLGYSLFSNNFMERLEAFLRLDEKSLEKTDREIFFNKSFRALAFNRIKGDYAEFGCASGMTFGLAYHQSRRMPFPVKLWAFDSFAGLPEISEKEDRHPKWKTGSMAMPLEDFHSACRKNKIPQESYQTVPGFYSKTLDSMSLTQTPTDICLAYIDCDLYSSTQSVLKFLMPRLKHGMILAFDDYFCYSDSQISGERKAMLEFFGENKDWNLLPFLTFGWHGMSFIVEDRKLLK